MSGASAVLGNGSGQPRVGSPWRQSVPFRRLASIAVPLLVPGAALLLWSVSSRAGWLPLQILPAPADVWSSFLDMARSGDLGRDTSISLSRVLEGFAIGGGLGLAFGATMGLSRTFEDYTRPIFTVVAQVPTIGWIPLLMIPLGIGEPLKLLIIADAALVPTALKTLNGIRAVPRAWFEVAFNVPIQSRPVAAACRAARRVAAGL